MNYYAVIQDETGTPIARMRVSNLEYRSASLTPVRLPQHWEAERLFTRSHEPDTISLDGIVTERYNNAVVPTIGRPPPERVITIPD